MSFLVVGADSLALLPSSIAPRGQQGYIVLRSCDNLRCLNMVAGYVPESTSCAGSDFNIQRSINISLHRDNLR